MDFSYSAEQQMLLDSARRYVREQYGFEQRRKFLASPAGRSAAAWRDFAELGLLGLNVPEADGGLGGSALDSLLVSIALGEGLVVEPYLSSAVLASRALARLGSAEQRARWLPSLADGTLIAAWVAGEAPAGPDAAPVTASAHGDGWMLRGRLPVVYHAPTAGLLLVAARSGAGSADDMLFAVPPDAPGLHQERLTTVDGQPAAGIVLDGTPVGASARVGAQVTGELAELTDFGLVALCGEALGALDRAMALTVEYTKSRQQFGQPLARFQALQHRMVDMKARIEQARSLVYLAAARFESADARQRASDASAAKVLVSDAARFVGEQAVQLHGGMGVSDEVSISHYFKRLLAVRLRFGSEHEHLARYARHMAIG